MAVVGDMTAHVRDAIGMSDKEWQHYLDQRVAEQAAFELRRAWHIKAESHRRAEEARNRATLEAWARNGIKTSHADYPREQAHKDLREWYAERYGRFSEIFAGAATDFPAPPTVPDEEARRTLREWQAKQQMAPAGDFLAPAKPKKKVSKIYRFEDGGTVKVTRMKKADVATAMQEARRDCLAAMRDPWDAR